MNMVRGRNGNNGNETGNTTNFDSGSQSLHIHAGTAEVCTASPGNPFSGLDVETSKISGPSTKRPTYSDHCTREKAGKYCKKSSRPYWHRYPDACWAANRLTLVADKSAESRARRYHA